MQSVNPLPLVTSFHPTAYRSIRFYGDVLCASLHLTLFSDDPADKTRCKICLWLYFPLSASDEFDTVYLWPRKFTSLWVLGKPKTDYLTSNEAQWCMWLTLDVQPCKNNKPIRLPPGNRDQKFDEREAIISDCYFRCSGHHSVQFVVTVLSGICPMTSFAFLFMPIMPHIPVAQSPWTERCEIVEQDESFPLWALWIHLWVS